MKYRVYFFYLVCFLLASCSEKSSKKENPCDNVDCSGHGTCRVENQTAVCDCDVNWHAQGSDCVPDDACYGVECSGHGTCTLVGENSPLCECEEGYHEQNYVFCEANDPVNPCEGIDCDGHGTCRVDQTEDGVDYPICDCENGYVNVGLLHCQEAENPCEGVDCSGHGTCVNGNEGPFCECDEGYVPDGITCVLAPFCGDGVVQEEEECDDANSDDSDGCTMSCRFSCHINEDCPTLNPPCSEATCDMIGNGKMCVTHFNNGVACNDESACTENDVCSNGVCEGTAITCDDENECTMNTCDAAMGCIFTPKNGEFCDDNNLCTQNDTCNSSGQCRGQPITCDDHDSCTVDTCEPATGCVFNQLPYWYPDGDRDGVGNTTGRICAEIQPTNYVDISGDCCDTNASVFPGQTNYFNTGYTCNHIVIPTFDYNCDGTSEKKYDQIASCNTATTVAQCNSAHGWQSTIPNCGQSGVYIYCRWIGTTCIELNPVSNKQECR